MNRNFIPLIAFFMIVAFAGAVLVGGKDKNILPSALLEKPLPEFDVPGLASKDLKKGGVALVNVFASWCETCGAEQPWLEKLSRDAPVYGIAYKDKKPALEAWLARHGNPFTAIGEDKDGRAAIEWGVYGVPETFVIDRQSIVRYRHVGAIDETAYETILHPLLKQLQER